MNKNEIKQEKFYVKTRMKTVEEDDNGTFMKRSFKFMGQL